MRVIVYGAAMEYDNCSFYDLCVVRYT